LPTCFERLEVFGGAETRKRLGAILTDDAVRAEIRDRQQRYVDALRAVCDAREALHRVLTPAPAP
jgi:hypothetical protein